MIPPGQVATYGQIATYVISPRYARAVGRALKELPKGRTKEVPWQRVINASGRISYRGEVARPALQEKLLRSEGVMFQRGRTNLMVFGWAGPPEGWRPPYEDPAPEKKRYVAGRAPLPAPQLSSERPKKTSKTTNASQPQKASKARKAGKPQKASKARKAGKPRTASEPRKATHPRKASKPRKAAKPRTASTPRKASKPRKAASKGRSR